MKRWQEVACAAVSDHPLLPLWDGGVPFCDDRCPHHDGKRCEALGRRPDGICEPVVAEMAMLLERVMP